MTTTTTIDNALKTFASYFAAANQDVSLTRTLELTRHLSKSINSYVISMDEKYASNWNQVVGQGKKPTKMFGVGELRIVWKDMAPPDESEEAILYYETFGRLLMPSAPDFGLIWATDGGQAELQRRAKERVERAQRNATADHGTPRIEELPDEDEN